MSCISLHVNSTRTIENNVVYKIDLQIEKNEFFFVSRTIQRKMFAFARSLMIVILLKKRKFSVFYCYYYYYYFFVHESIWEEIIHGNLLVTVCHN